MGINQSNVHILDYFRSSANIEADKEARISIMQKLHTTLVMFFTGTGYFGGIFKQRVK